MEQINLPNLSHGLDMRHYDAGTQDDIPNAVIQSSELHPYTLTVSGKQSINLHAAFFSSSAGDGTVGLTWARQALRATSQTSLHFLRSSY